MNHVCSILKQALSRLQLAYEPDAAGRLVLFFDDTRIEVTPSEQSVRLQYRLAALPDEPLAREQRLMLFARMSAGNLASLDTTPETLSINPTGQNLLLFTELPADHIEVDDFLDKLADFVDAAEYWHRIGA